MTRQQFEDSFPVELAIENTLREVAVWPLAEQVAFYVSRLHCSDGISGEDAERWLIANGRPAGGAQMPWVTLKISTGFCSKRSTSLCRGSALTLTVSAGGACSHRC